MRPGLSAGREQGFEQFPLEFGAPALNDVALFHGFQIKPTSTRRKRNDRSGAVYRIRTTHATLKLNDVSGFRADFQVSNKA